MNKTTPVNPLSATIAIHNILFDDEGFAGYGCDIEQFNMLYREVEAIIAQLIDPDLLDLDNVIETYFGIQTQIAEGELIVDWFL